MFDEMNSVKTVRDGIVTDNMDFSPLKNFVGTEIPVDGFFFTNGKYGEQTVVIGLGHKINMPMWATPKWKEIKDSPEKLRAVMDGKLVLKEIKSVKTNNGTTISYKFGDR